MHRVFLWIKLKNTGPVRRDRRYLDFPQQLSFSEAVGLIPYLHPDPVRTLLSCQADDMVRRAIEIELGLIMLGWELQPNAQPMVSG